MSGRVRILSNDSVLPTWGRQQSAAVESYEESFSASEDLQFENSYIHDESGDLPSVLIVSGDPGSTRWTASVHNSAYNLRFAHLG